jgi:hypothetical protein
MPAVTLTFRDHHLSVQLMSEDFSLKVFYELFDPPAFLRAVYPRRAGGGAVSRHSATLAAPISALRADRCGHRH